MPPEDEIDEALERAAVAAGLEAFLAHDREGLARAFKAAEGYRSRRTVVTDLSLEPAHVYRVPEAGAGEGS